MALASGNKLGPYEIQSLLGAGGMGEVYRAHDPRLARDVALKVLPQAFAADSERMARFEREAVSAQSGRAQVYLQAFPGPGERVQVSTEGGSEPVWAPNGSELYFRTPTKFMAVDVKARPALAVGKPRLLFEGEFRLTHHDYGLLPDGRHFIMIQPVGKKPPAELHVVVNWADELKARLAAARN